MMQLADKTVLITGGARGIGLELAKLCATDGATVLLADISEPHLREAVDSLRAQGANAHAFVHDITDRNACYALASRIAGEFGPVHVLFNNAGVGPNGDFLAGDDEAWKHTVDVNLLGLMWMMRAFMPAMVARGDGHVVNVASILGIIPLAGLAAYCATKHAMVALTETVRFELLERGCTGVTLTTACPGFTDTGMFVGVKPPRGFGAVPPQYTAQDIYRAMKLRARFVLPFPWNFMRQAYALLPHAAWRWLTRVLGIHRAVGGAERHGQLSSGHDGGTGRTAIESAGSPVLLPRGGSHER